MAEKLMGNFMKSLNGDKIKRLKVRLLANVM